MKPEFEDIPDMAAVYGEPCNNCALWSEGLWCEKGHRQKDVVIATGHIPDLTVRRVGGCSDHAMKESGPWWHEDPIKPHQSGYGGSSTNLLL